MKYALLLLAIALFFRAVLTMPVEPEPKVIADPEFFYSVEMHPDDFREWWGE